MAPEGRPFTVTTCAMLSRLGSPVVWKVTPLTSRPQFDGLWLPLSVTSMDSVVLSTVPFIDATTCDSPPIGHATIRSTERLIGSGALLALTPALDAAAAVVGMAAVSVALSCIARAAASSRLSGERGAVASEHAAALASSNTATRCKERLAI